MVYLSSQNHLKISDIRFAAEPAFSRSALKAELILIRWQIERFHLSAENKRNIETLNFKQDQYKQVRSSEQQILGG